MHIARTVAVLVLTLAAIPAAGDSVSGYFRMGEGRVDVAHGCAYLIPGEEAPKKLVFLADKPLDCAAAETALDPEEALDDQVEAAKGGYVRIVIDPAGETQSLYYSITEPFDSFNTAGFGEWTETVATNERTEASWKIEERDFFDKKYAGDLSWSLPLNGAPIRGEALPAGGGAPGAALTAYVKAVTGDDTAALRQVATAEIIGSTLESEGTEWFAEQWKYFKEYELAEVEVLGGTVDGDRATLKVKGVQGDGEKVEGSVRMVKADGAWKLQAKKLSYVF